MIIAKERIVTMNYTLKNDTGEVLDTSEGREPLVYLHGVGALIAGLESELEGKAAADKFNVKLEPENAYGTHREDLLRKVSKDGFQGEEELTLGMRVQMETEHGPVVAVVSDITGDDVTLDLNHPLADTTLHFDVDVVSVREASAEEISHGHVHGEGGHDH